MGNNRGSGRGSGKGFSGGNRRGNGRGPGRGNNAGPGPDGKCICPECGTTMTHERGVPCYNHTCPQCGTQMIREGITSTQHQTNTRTNNNIPEINKEKCTGCGQCVNICPFNAISLDNGKAKIDSTVCRNCKQCIRACPVRAINP